MDMEDFSEGFQKGLREILGEKDQGLLRNYFIEMLIQIPRPEIDSLQFYQQPLEQLTPNALGGKPGANSECDGSQLTPQAKAWACPTCLSGFVSHKGLSQHIAKTHDKPAKTTHCLECDKVFTHKYALKFHVTQVHLRSTRVSCLTCGKVLYNKYAYKVHLVLMHS
jgi:DNA-directed RNA polymerase subunit N (RpoN/RPB10)